MRKPSILSSLPAGILLASALTALPALAASSGWHDGEGGRLRIVTASAPDANGMLQGVLQIELKPGWKTYWRDPGDSGVPPQVTVEIRGKIRQARIAFPAPTRHDDGYSQWAGYDRSVLLPVSLPLEAGRQAALTARVMIGMCEKICIPVQADLVIDPERPSQQIVEEALVHNAVAALPAPAAPGFTASSGSAAGDKLIVEAALPEGAEAAELFLAGEDGYAFGTPVPRTAAGRLSFEVPVLARPAEKPSGQGLPYTLTSSAGAVSGFLPYP